MENASGDISTELLETPTADRFSAQGVRVAALVFVDNGGIARMKCVPLDRLERAAERGVGLSVVFGERGATTCSPRFRVSRGQRVIFGSLPT